jgi:hypothetical protein
MVVETNNGDDALEGLSFYDQVFWIARSDEEGVRTQAFRSKGIFHVGNETPSQFVSRGLISDQLKRSNLPVDVFQHQ